MSVQRFRCFRCFGRFRCFRCFCWGTDPTHARTVALIPGPPVAVHRPCSLLDTSCCASCFLCCRLPFRQRPLCTASLSLPSSSPLSAPPLPPPCTAHQNALCVLAMCVLALCVLALRADVQLISTGILWRSTAARLEACSQGPIEPPECRRARASASRASASRGHIRRIRR